MRIETEHMLAFDPDASRADSGMPPDGDLPGDGKRTPPIAIASKPTAPSRISRSGRTPSRK